MDRKLWQTLLLILGILGTGFSYGYGFHGGGFHRNWGWGGTTNVIIGSPYYNDYNSYYNPYVYYPQYRCMQVPQCYPSGSCNYQTQQCGYW
jgi:hypothetical protein